MLTKIPGWRLLLVSFVVNFGGAFHFGYQLVITNPTQQAFLQFLNSSFSAHYDSSLTSQQLRTIWSTTVAVLFIGAIFGSLSIRSVGEHFGRKRGLYFSFATTILATILSIIAFFVNSFELYAISRILIGFAISLSLGLAALYLNESSPKDCRGLISMIIGVMVQFGTVIGAIIAMPNLLGTYDHLWHIYFIEGILLVFTVITLPLMPESPGYLSLCGHEEAASQSIMFFHNCDLSSSKMVLMETKENLKQNSKALSLFEVFSDHQTVRSTFTGMVIAISMAFSGIAGYLFTVINAFAVDIFLHCGLSLMEASIGNIVLSAVSLLSFTDESRIEVAIILSSCIVDRFGRRPLLLITISLIILINLIIFTLMFLFNKFGMMWIGYVLIAVISLFIIIFAMGPGPLTFFVTTELVHQNARAAAQSWASFTQMLSRTVLLGIYLPLQGAIGQAFAYVILFIVPLVAALLFLYFNMPETKNKNINEVSECLSGQSCS
ncbi:unnamed protein product [Anisakis simplex]|uniref:Glucose transporter type 1 (inferred by orthology to a D. melanogaster protein) n=1 Tax=Anisakis simplex TaxID=6269 RepID=A0A0M3JX39_ANISI|nr:unnamed protein product [Anisakis simplex]